MPSATPARTGILFMDTCTFAGAVFSVIRSIVRSLDRARFRPIVAVDTGMTGSLQLPDDVEVTRWKFRAASGRPSVSDFGKGPVAVARFVRRENVAVLHCSQEIQCSLIGICIARLTGAKALIHQHTAPDRGGPLALRKIAIDLADANLGISEFISRSVRHNARRKRAVDCIVNGTDLKKFRPGIDGGYVRREYGIAEDEILFLQLGRLEDYKRQEDFVRAFAVAKRAVPKLRGLLIGWEDPRFGGSHRRQIEETCRQLDLGDAIITDDARTDPAHVHSAADVFVMPAVDEPFGLVVIEAMACAKPVVGVRSGALPELIVDGETGLLVPPRSPRELGEAMIRLAQDVPLRTRLGASGRARAVAKYSEERLGAQLAEVYDRLAPPRGRRSASLGDGREG
jgi:glycosyltransferase involved in cell wall biosynthesis